MYLHQVRISRKVKMDRHEYQDSEDRIPRRRTLTDILKGYGNWRRKQVKELADTPLRSLALKSLFYVLCITVDGILIPSVILIFDRTAVAYILFGALLISAVAAESFLYRKFLRI